MGITPTGISQLIRRSEEIDYKTRTGPALSRPRLLPTVYTPLQCL